MTQISYLSDNSFKMVVRTLEGERIDLSTTWLKVYIKAGGKTFTAVHDPLRYDTKNCHIEDIYLVVDVPSKRLGIGAVEYMIETREESQYFPDGYKNTFSLKYEPTDIEIV